ncbi:MAG: DUF3782 domain-containing protein [Acidilobaceae archaeon]
MWLSIDYGRLLEDIRRVVREVVEEARREDIARIGEALSKMTLVLEGILGELREHRRILEEHSKILKEHSRILEEHSRILEGHTKILEGHSAMLKEHSRMLGELKVMVGSMGRRWGRDFEETVLAIYKDELARRGLDVRFVRRFSYVDVDGRFGLKGNVYEFDVIIEGDGVTVVEVKSRATRDDVVWFYEKVRRVESLLGSVKRLLVVAVNIDKEALERAQELGIDTIYGAVIE